MKKQERLRGRADACFRLAGRRLQQLKRVSPVVASAACKKGERSQAVV